MEGKGIFTSANGSIYEGDFKCNIMHGRILEKHIDGSRYEGLYELGQKHGKGRAMDKNGRA
jgi:hypothetical protein